MKWNKNAALIKPLNKANLYFLEFMNVPKEWNNKVDTFVFGFGGSLAGAHVWGPGSLVGINKSRGEDTPPQVRSKVKFVVGTNIYLQHDQCQHSVYSEFRERGGSHRPTKDSSSRQLSGNWGCREWKFFLALIIFLVRCLSRFMKDVRQQRWW